MTDRVGQPRRTDELRRRAEELARENEAGLPDETLQTLYELRVHQIELEMQCEELRRMQHDLEASQRRYFALYDQAPVGYLTIDERGVIQEANITAATMLDTAQNDLLKKPITQIIFREDQTVYYLYQKKVIGTDKAEECELRLVRADGSPFWARLLTSHEPNGEFWIVWTDITERKRTEEALQKSEARFRAIFERSTVGKALTGSDEKLLHVNQAFADMLGYTVDEIQQLYFGQITHPDDMAASKECIRILMAGEQASHRFEKRYIHKSGTAVWADVSATMLCDEQGTSQNVIISIVDITARKRAEEERLLLERQLQQAQKMEAIGQLAGGVAHDFNNKLMVIMGNVTLAQMNIDDHDRVIKHLEEINRAAELSRDIASRLLTFSRRQVICPQILKANHVIAESLKSLTRLIGEHIAITFIPDDTLWNIQIDPVQLDQVVMNLAVNARDAMPDGGTFAIKSKNVTMDSVSCVSNIACVPGEYVCISFNDSGTGMSQETLTRIFEPFFTTKVVGKGTGLGLATIYGIINQNKGFIDVVSTLGSGTTFNIYLPRYDSPVTESIKANDTFSLFSGSILLIEDEDALRRVTAQFLKAIGFSVYEAATPCNALELAHDHSIQFDVVLTDFIMPEMNGNVLVERIREIRPDIKYLFVSGYSADHAALAGGTISGGTFIQKPYDLKKLSEQLKRVINSK